MTYTKIFHDKNTQTRIKVSRFAEYAREIIKRYKEPIPLDDLIVLLKAKLEKENIGFVESWISPNFEHGIKVSICFNLEKRDHERIEWPEK